MGEAIGRLLAAGNVAEVFECGPHVVKLYKSPAAKAVAFREAGIHATVGAMGLPVPAVWGVRSIERRWGIVFDRVTAPSFADQMRANPGAIPDYLGCMARLHSRIHACVTAQLAGFKHKLAANIRQTALLDEPQATAAGRPLRDGRRRPGLPRRLPSHEHIGRCRAARCHRLARCLPGRARR